MADQFTTAAGSEIAPSVPNEQAQSQPATTTNTPKDLPAGKFVNGFTGEYEDLPPLNLAASPADQRILASPPHTDPLPVLIERAANGRDDDAGINVDEHVGPSLTQDALPGETPLAVIRPHETPDLNRESGFAPPTQHVDALSANDQAVEDGRAVNHEGNPDLAPYVGMDTKAYNDSLNARKEAEANAVSNEELPEVQPAVPGDQVDEQPTPAEPVDGEPVGPTEPEAASE